MSLLHRVKHADIQFQTVDLSSIASEILTDLQASHPTRSVEVAIADSLITQGDPVLLRVVLENLLSNAWKYSTKTPRTRIEFNYLESSATFYIKDNGIGFDMKHADKLFEPFQRLHDSAEFSGTGIRLASVARIIEQHCGRIWVESMPNRGTTFFFTLIEQEDSQPTNDGGKTALKGTK